MTKTEAIIWKRIQEKAERMASQETLHSFTEREVKCWNAHCYKYINAYGKVNYILSQEEFEKFKWLCGLHQVAYEAVTQHKLPIEARAIIKAVFHEVFPDYEVLESLFAISPMWDDREKST